MRVHKVDIYLARYLGNDRVMAYYGDSGILASTATHL